LPNHPLDRGQENSGVKLGAFSKDYKLAEIKTKCKEAKCTLNDAVTAAISVSLKEYFLSRGDEKTSQILMGIAYNVRSKPKNSTEFYFGNEVSMMPFSVPLFSNFAQGLSYFHRTLSTMKNSGSASGMFALSKLILLLPYSVAQQVIYFLCGRISVVVTNVFGPTQPL